MSPGEAVPSLQRLEDRAAITDVCLRYATALDTRDWQLLRTCFTPDAVTHYGPGPALEGYDAFERVSREWMPAQVRSQHLIANVAVEVDGDVASSSCYVRADHVHEELPGEHLEFVGRYLDELVRTGEGWRIRHRRFEIFWTHGRGEVLGWRG